LREVAQALDRWDGWFYMQDKGWHLAFDGGRATWHTFVHRVLLEPTKLELYEVSAVLIASVVLLVLLAYLRPPWPLLDEWRDARENELLARWREEAARNGRAATGWDETLQAASEGRVELLLVQYRLDEQSDAKLELAVHQTLTHGGTVEVIGEDHRDLEPVGGVAALLRF